MNLIEVTAPQVDLVPSKVYYAKLNLTGVETLATVAMVQAQFIQLGFGVVTVWASSPPSDKFPDTTPYPQGNTFWIEGTWMGSDEMKAMPAQVKRVWTEGIDADAPDAPPQARPGPAPAPRQGPQPAPQETPGPTPAATPLDPAILILAALAYFALREG